MEEEKKLSNKAIEYINETYKRSWEDYRATHKRFDYLLITVDGAGVYLSLELMKYIADKGLDIPLIIKLSGVFLAMSIILNFLAQFFTFNVFHNVLKIEQAVAMDKPGGIEKFQKKISRYNFLSALLMWLSILSMIVVVIGLTIIIWKTF